MPFPSELPELAPVSLLRTTLLLNIPLQLEHPPVHTIHIVHTVPMTALASHTPVQPVTLVPLTQQSSIPPASHTPVQSVTLAQQRTLTLASHTPVHSVHIATVNRPPVHTVHMVHIAIINRHLSQLSQMSQSLTLDQPTKTPIPNVPIAHTRPTCENLYPKYPNRLHPANLRKPLSQRNLAFMLIVC